MRSSVHVAATDFEDKLVGFSTGYEIDSTDCSWEAVGVGFGALEIEFTSKNVFEQIFEAFSI